MTKRKSEKLFMDNLNLWRDQIIEDHQKKIFEKDKKELKKMISKINDSDIKKILLRDCEELLICCDNSAWKAAIVMSGSIIEAVLLDRLKQERVKVESEYSKVFNKSKKIEEFNLNELISISEKLDFLDKSVAKLCDSLRDYRNLIHPGKEKRTSGIKVSKSVAEIGKNAVFHLLENLK